jgi:hypothetical protein
MKRGLLNPQAVEPSIENDQIEAHQ